MKKTLSSATLFACCGAYSNIIFMGQPLIKALYGEKGLIFCVAVMFVSTLYLFTICSILLSLGTDKMKDSAKVLKDSFFESGVYFRHHWIYLLCKIHCTAENHQ
ncbi:AEC family transporter [Anaerotignum sp.]|uniref:AEC family transporter n=1 Tax=Anaerotignum sp. TaxID=2039241 RepID=UPI0011C818AD